MTKAADIKIKLLSQDFYSVKNLQRARLPASLFIHESAKDSQENLNKLATVGKSEV
ncbi:MAG: hypothetical protein LBT38_04680 [Deltaproteobacteria bacterium]|nr:hypothetical protein [Deltaproteobacteria bacterium]